MNNLNGGTFFSNGPNMPISTHVRFLNIIQGMPSVDLYVDGSEYYKDIANGEFTGYTSVPPGVYNVELYRAGEHDNPIEHTNETFAVGNSFTVAATGDTGDIKLYQIMEPYSSPAPGLRSYLRLVNLSEDTPPLDVTLQNGVKIFDNVKFAELTNYARLVPNTYSLVVNSSEDGKNLLNIPDLLLQAGKIYSVYIINDESGKAPIRALFTSDSEYTD